MPAGHQVSRSSSWFSCYLDYCQKKDFLYTSWEYYSTLFITCYTGIFVASRRHNKHMSQKGRQSLAALKREKQLAWTIGFILLVLGFTFLPALASPIVLTTMGYRGLAPFRPFFTVLITFNGLINPLINCGRNDSIRRSIRDLFVCSRATRHVPRAAVVPGRDMSFYGETSHSTSKGKLNFSA